jgi:hypothetical protein
MPTILSHFAELGLDAGGWVSRGRLAEDGVLPECYPLTETPSANHSQRSRGRFSAGP